MQRSSLLILLAAVSFLPAIGFYIVGEEGIYTISSLEMWFNKNWLIQTLYGTDLSRPPAMNWFVIPFAELAGWSNVLRITRAVSIAATLGMVGWLYWLGRKLFGDRSFALFAALSCIVMADLLFYRGWLAYTDPVFSFFTFGAIAALWAACVDRHRGWLTASVLMVSLAMLSKAFTAYVFFGTAWAVLLRQRPYRSFLLSHSAFGILLLALLIPAAWFMAVPHQGGHSTSMLDEIVRKLSAQGLASYLGNLVGFPLETALRLSPAIPIALYLVLRKRVIVQETAPMHFRTAMLICGLCFLPYWLSPQSSIRYLLPIYPLFALVAARLVWRTGESGRVLAMKWYSGITALKFLFALALVPWYQHHYRGENYLETARQIMRETSGYPLYTTDVSASGLSVASYVDTLRLPGAPIAFPPEKWDSGFVIAYTENPELGKTYKVYRLGGDRMYLLCRGGACSGGR